jgi:serine/threonine protein kinase
VDIYDVGTHDGHTYLVMELLEGESLEAFLRRNGALDVTGAAELMIPVLAGIACAHEAGVIHRDLKPANIFLSVDRRGEIAPKVVDFGISKIVSADLNDSLTGSGILVGTPFYMSPEQAQGGKPIDARSDLYTLGVILYEMVTGRQPFKNGSVYEVLRKIVGGAYERPCSIRPELDEAAERIIRKAMARSPDERFASAADFARALLVFTGDRARLRWTPEFERPNGSSGAFSSATVEAALSEARSSLTLLGGESLEIPRRAPKLALGAAALTMFTIALVALLTLRLPRSDVVQIPVEPRTEVADASITPGDAGVVIDDPVDPPPPDGGVDEQRDGSSPPRPRPGTISVAVSCGRQLSITAVWIDGKKYEDPDMIKISSGRHTLLARRKDGKQIRMTVHVIPGRDTPVALDICEGEV